MSSTSAAAASSESATHLGDLGRAPTPNAPSPTAATSSHPTPAPEVNAAQTALPPEPGTIHDADASEHSTILDDQDAANAAATYGTRSRNRPGRARPNYADDKDIDLEIEAAGKISKVPKKTPAATAQTALTKDMDVVPTRNGFAAVNGTTSGPYPPVTSTNIGLDNSASSANSTSKKRKQPGSSVTVTANQPPLPHTSSLHAAHANKAHLVESNMMRFTRSRKRLNSKQQLVADDGTTIEVNDHMYFLCEPPGEPYYLGRIMEFLHVDNSSTNPVEAVRVNWFYRPKDIQRRVQDTRVVFASMHSDTCPLSSARGKCHIRHLADISDLDEFRKQSDSFWFDKLYDRYMHRYYEVVPTSKVVNVPRNVKKVLDERWKFVLVEVGRGRDLTSASKVCKRCSDFAANHESVDCAVCKNTYHMSCVRPPLLKKPARGFAWACGPCSRAQELKMEARHTPMSENELSRLAEAESFDDDEDDSQPQDLTTRDNSVGPEDHPPPTEAQLAQANLWQWRYLGIHARPEDALDYDDRIYPRASSRLGPRHQANVTVWHGRPIEFIKPAEGKKRYKPAGSNKKDAKTAALLENDKRPKRPKWVFDEPPGYLTRGEDDAVEFKGKKEYSAQLTFKMPDPSKFTERGLEDDQRPDNFDHVVDAYLQQCDQDIAPKYNLQRGNVDIRTKALEKLQENEYDVEKALDAMRKLSLRTDLKIPDLSKEEVKRFEEGVAKYGSELHLVARHISPTIKESRIVRFYYMWKKTPRGREVWGNYEGRKSKKDSKRVEKDANGSRLLQDVGDDADDSAFDEEKAKQAKRGFKCKFCCTTASRIWRRAPATAPGSLVPRDPSTKNAKDKSNWLVLALCGKCAYLWRRYAVQYESIEEIGKKIAISGGRASKRKVDEELMRIVLEAQNFAGDVITKNTAQIASTAGIEVPAAMVESEELSKKKPKTDLPIPPTEVVLDKKKLAPEKSAELEPLKPEMPRVKEHPCAVCHIMNHPDHKMLKCRDCRLHVHAPCYGTTVSAGNGPWYCDTCKNDHNTQVSTNYECILCPVRRTPQELMEPPKVSHKKKTDREREKERAEREMVQEAGRRWREDQLAAGRPVDPREPLKRTAWNNWIHVNCAVWCKEIRFGDADRLDAAEGLGFVPQERLQTACKFCNETGFPTVTCHFPACNNNFHVGCAHQRKLTLGFDISPVKMSRRDSVPVMKLDQESGLAVPGIWCSHHAVPTIVHNMLEQTPSGMTALQEFVHTYKQVDNSTTGTVRRAAQFQQSVPAMTGINTGQPLPRSASGVNGQSQPSTQAEVEQTTLARSPSPLSPQLNGDNHEPMPKSRDVHAKTDKKCCTCLTTYSPKWWQIEPRAMVLSPESQQGQRSKETIEILPGRHSTSVQPISPVQQHHQMHGHNGILPASLATHNQVKPEPMDVDTKDVPRESVLQCHKCHVNKRTPPSSPALTQRVQQTSPRPQMPPAQQNPATINNVSQPAPEVPAHTHPAAHPPPHAYPNGNPAWTPPSFRNGVPSGPPPPVPYHHPPPYHRPNEYGYYPAPVHYGVPSGLPPPGPRPNGVPQHSPPPGPFAHPIHGHSQQVSGGQVSSPHIPSSAGPSPYGPRPGESPYGPARGYPPPPAPQAQPPAPGPGLGHITRLPQEQLGQARRPSQDSVTTPRLGMSRLGGVIESPRMSHQSRDEPPREMDSLRDRRSSTAGPGASASPSLKNLLS